MTLEQLNSPSQLPVVGATLIILDSYYCQNSGIIEAEITHVGDNTVSFQDKVTKDDLNLDTSQYKFHLNQKDNAWYATKRR
jgi:hypothetical protein